MRIYIAGKITGCRGYRRKFAKAERALRKKGHSVMNPAWLKACPEFSWADYMAVSGAMQKTCDAVFLLDNWQDSRGARGERRRSAELGQRRFYSIRDVPDARERRSRRRFPDGE